MVCSRFVWKKIIQGSAQRCTYVMQRYDTQFDFKETIIISTAKNIYADFYNIYNGRVGGDFFLRSYNLSRLYKKNV